MTCSTVYPSGLRCKRSSHGDSVYCWQHDPELKEARRKGYRFSASDVRTIQRLDEICSGSAADTGLWRDLWEDFGHV